MLDILLPFTLLLVIYNMYLFFYEIIKKCNNKKDIIYSSFFASLICFIIMLALQNYLYDNLSPINTPVMTLIYGGMEESFKIWSIFRIKIHKKINDSYTAMAYFLKFSSCGKDILSNFAGSRCSLNPGIYVLIVLSSNIR